MTKPIAISIGLFLFLFGLAFAKAEKSDEKAQSRLREPAAHVFVAK